MSDCLPFRQIHLDFHTSELIPGIGADFDRREFQETLRIGHVSSVTVFAKGHHGNFYYTSERFHTHPHLQCELTREMVDACHEIGVNAPVYISAGVDEYAAWQHPEWRFENRERPSAFLVPTFHLLCLGTPYLDYLTEQTREVVTRFPDADGIFFDICAPRPCTCKFCTEGMVREGLDPEKREDVETYGERVYARYCKRMNETVHSIVPGMRIFHNGGTIRRGRRDMAACNTHLELESLPTGGWGYDHFPLSMRYCQQLPYESVGMTGKFHQSWGEFGGFKHPNALIYETALSVAMGAKCSIGDQMHPRARLLRATYEEIGPAYARIEKLEPWLSDVESVADVALLSEEVFGKKDNGDRGANRTLLEGKFLYDVVDCESDFAKYKLLILPDDIPVEGALRSKLKAFTAAGGKLLCTGSSGTDGAGNFLFDLGAADARECAYPVNYLVPREGLDIFSAAPYAVYAAGYDITATGEVLADRAVPYFNRTSLHFCSHRQAPDNPEAGLSPAVTVGSEGAYISWPLFSEYFATGSITTRRMLCRVIERLLGSARTLTTSLPAQGVVTLQHQKGKGRYICHLLYAVPVRRGEKTDIIEDITPLYDVAVSVRLPEGRIPRRVSLAPEGEEIPFTVQDGVAEFTLPKLWCHAPVVLEY